MNQRRKPDSARDGAAGREMRDAEVLRANKELTAYFKGERTEREARAALKIIKAFVRDRERRDAKTRAPLPGAKVVKKAIEVANRRTAGAGGEPRRPKTRRKPRKKSESATTSIASPETTTLPHATESDEPTP